MRRQKCAQCGTMLDISKLEGGSKFACASCGAILVVGEATAVKKSFKESGPAFTPKGKTEAPPPAPSRRREERPERAPRRGDEAEKKSRMPLFVGLGVVAVGIVVAIVLSTGGGGGQGGTKGLTPAEWWATQQARLSSASADELRALREEGRAKYGGDAAFWADKEGQIEAALLRKDPSDKTANEKKGNRNLRDYPDFDKVYARLLETYKRLPPELQNFADTLSEVPGSKDGSLPAAIWLSPEKYQEACAKLDEFAAWLKKAEENPAAGAIESFTREARERLSTSARKIGFGALSEGPFVLLLAYEESGGEAAKNDLMAEGRKWAGALRVLQEEFDRRIREPLGVPAIEAGKYYCVLAVPTADDLKKLIGQGGGLDASGDIDGYFSPTTKWSHVRQPKEANEKALFGGDLGHEAFHQLQLHYSADPKQKAWNYMQEWSGIWLSEGLAEYLGGGIDLDPATGKASFSGKPPRRVEFLRGMRDNGMPMMPIRDLVQIRPDNLEKQIDGWFDTIRSGEDLPEAATQWWLTQDGRRMKLLYAQSWLLVQFLYEAEGGKYRAQLMDLVLTALRGGQKPDRYRKDPGVAERFAGADDAFAEILGLKDESQWQALQAAHDRHLRSLRGE